MVHNLVHNLCESLVTNIGDIADTGKRTPPTPITYLTQWKIVGNSEVHGTEIWSCGEYNATDGKYHILVQPQGGNIADIALDEPLRKVNDVADTIEFPSETEGKALVTRNLKSVVDMSTLSWAFSNATIRMYTMVPDIKDSLDSSIGNLLCPIYPTVSNGSTKQGIFGIAAQSSPLAICVYDENYITPNSRPNFLSHVQDTSLIYQLATPTTELVDAPQIEEAESYTCEISQGAKAVEWSSFTTN